MKRTLLLLFPLLTALGAGAAQAPQAANIDWNAYENLAQNLFQSYLRVNTSNPPGNEMRAVPFWKAFFDREGIENRAFPYAPNRGDFLAILHGDGSRRPLILLNHMDVVTSVPSRWIVPPFSGVVRDGEIYGRGAEDMKDEGLAQAITMLVLKREHIPLKRDVIFLGVADEEADGTGSEYMIAHQRAALRNAEYLMTEGGENLRDEHGPVRFIGIDVAEKAPYWLHLSATGTPGHGSRPIADSAPNRLVRALARVMEWQTPMRAIPQVQEFFRSIASRQPSPQREQFQDVTKALEDPQFRQWVTQQGDYNYMLRDTVSLTMLGGSQQTNVIPGEAWANLDVRLLPGTDPKDFLKQVEGVVADPSVKVVPPNRFRPPNSSPTDSELYRIFEAVARKFYSNAPVTPRLLSGFTESEMYRQIGINAYGFSPYVVTEDEGNSEHGDNERIAVSEFREGQPVLFEVVRRLVTGQAP